MKLLSSGWLFFLLVTVTLVLHSQVSMATDTCTSDTMNTNLYCTDKDDDCSVCSPNFDDYSLEFDNANTVQTWNPNPSCEPNEYGKSYCNYSINGNELIFYFNQHDGDGMPQIADDFNDQIKTYQSTAYISETTLFFGVNSLGGLPVPPEEMYFFDCGELTINYITVNVCIGQKHHFHDTGHYWLMAAPNFDYSDPDGVNNAVLLMSCFQNGCGADTITGCSEFSMVSISQSQGLGALNCSCLVANQYCDDISDEISQGASQQVMMVLKGTKSLVNAAKSLGDDFSEFILDLTQPNSSPEELDELLQDLDDT